MTSSETKPVVMVSKEVQFDAGHRVPNHKSKCRNPHGHRYRVVVYCVGSIVTERGSSDEGMLVDFGDLKKLMMQCIHDPLDHSMIIWEGDDLLLNALVAYPKRERDVVFNIVTFPFIPTAENIAIWCWNELEHRIENLWGNYELRMNKIEVWETPTSMACYSGATTIDA